MNFRKWALVLGAAASCAGCVTESKSVEVSSENIGKFKNIRETEYAKQEPKATTHLALGQLKEANAADIKVAPVQQEKLRDEARCEYQKAIELDPHCIPAHIALAAWYSRQDDDVRAITICQNAAKVNPTSSALWYEQGVLHLRRKDLNNAVACLGKAHELDPEDKHKASQFGLCLARAGRPQDGVTVLCKVMNKADANYTIARMMDHCNQPELCRQYLTAALQERPTHMGAQQLWAQVNGPPNYQAPNVANTQPMDANVRPAAAWDGPR
jgi:tetratricopeptide (TPR) repeat protein